MNAERAGRAGRGALAGALTTFLALAFHVFGGGESPGSVALGASLLATVWIGVVLAGRRPRLWRLVLSVALGQLVLHAVFAMATAEVAAPGAAGPHDHGTVLLGALVHGGHAMAAAHVAAGVVTILGILLGDRLITVAVRAASRLVAAILLAVRVLVEPLPAARPAPRLEVPALLGRIVAVVPRRGPPLPAC